VKSRRCGSGARSSAGSHAETRPRTSVQRQYAGVDGRTDTPRARGIITSSDDRTVAARIVAAHSCGRECHLGKAHCQRKYRNEKIMRGEEIHWREAQQELKGRPEPEDRVRTEPAATTSAVRSRVEAVEAAEAAPLRRKPRARPASFESKVIVAEGRVVELAGAAGRVPAGRAAGAAGRAVFLRRLLRVPGGGEGKAAPGVLQPGLCRRGGGEPARFHPRPRQGPCW
jgi:hypothetical protein